MPFLPSPFLKGRQKSGRSPRRDRNRVGAELNLADVFIGREGGRQCSAAKCRGVGIVEGWGCCVAAQHLYTTISPAHDKSPVAVRPPLSYRRSYFNILKFYPKCAVYQNFYHKLLARLSSPYLPVSLFYSLCPLSSRTRTCPFDPRTWKINGRCRRISRFEPSLLPLPPSLLASLINNTRERGFHRISYESLGFHRARYSTLFY